MSKNVKNNETLNEKKKLTMEKKIFNIKKISISFFLKENKNKNKNTQHAYKKKIKPLYRGRLEILMTVIMVKHSGRG